MLWMAVALASAAPTGGWQTYANARFGFSICYPSAVLKPGREATNSDGRGFSSTDGAELSVWGSNDLDQTGVKGELDNAAVDIRKRGGTVSYRAGGGNWGTISGSNGDTVWYEKSFSRQEQTVSFRLTYPRNLSGKFDPIASRISKCFRPGVPAY